ncbi:hypothetical protein ORJ04_20990 [Rheinheimera baltica]|uniref:Uncharacterized protein n=1 Tax=Rheinheimera baltica TaxID=67576 RepID=A0ABT9I4V5_9GAMM|nr:hypothetical protein [Rheinheimera baltica]MDP5138427.1 hypothetical protein [Rheinheimera baltica]
MNTYNNKTLCWELDLSHWQPEDKAWMKARKALWQQLTLALSSYNNYELKGHKLRLTKEYFFKGTTYMENNSAVGYTSFGHRDVLLMMWLHPSEERDTLAELWQCLDESARESVLQDFRMMIDDSRYADYEQPADPLNQYPFEYNGDSFFNGKDAVLFDVVVPKTFREWPRMTRILGSGEYNNRLLLGKASGTKHSVCCLLKAKKPNPYYYGHFVLPLWVDTLHYSLGFDNGQYQSKEELERQIKVNEHRHRTWVELFQLLQNIANNPEQYSEFTCTYAAKVDAVLKTETLPEAIHKHLEALRQEALQVSLHE